MTPFETRVKLAKEIVDKLAEDGLIADGPMGVTVAEVIVRNELERHDRELGPPKVAASRDQIKEIKLPPIKPGQICVVPPEPRQFVGAMVTGSHAYGTPRVDSDLDLVVYLEPKHRDLFEASAELTSEDEGPATPYDPDGSQRWRFGKLDLIVCFRPDVYDEWEIGTDQLLERKRVDGPVNRAEALDHFRNVRSGAAFFDKEDGNG